MCAFVSRLGHWYCPPYFPLYCPPYCPLYYPPYCPPYCPPHCPQWQGAVFKHKAAWSTRTVAPFAPQYTNYYSAFQHCLGACNDSVLGRSKQRESAQAVYPLHHVLVDRPLWKGFMEVILWQHCDLQGEQKVTNGALRRLVLAGEMVLYNRNGYRWVCVFM